MNKFKWLAIGAVGALAVLGVYGYIHRDMFLLDDEDDEDCGGPYASCDGNCESCECHQECCGEDEDARGRECEENEDCDGCKCREGCTEKPCQVEA